MKIDETKLKMVSVSNKGQIAIPKEITDMLDIKKGDRLILIAVKKKILVEKSETITKRMGDDFNHLGKLSENTVKKLWNNNNDKIWNSL